MPSLKKVPTISPKRWRNARFCWRRVRHPAQALRLRRPSSPRRQGDRRARQHLRRVALLCVSRVRGRAGWCVPLARRQSDEVDLDQIGAAVEDGAGAARISNVRRALAAKKRIDEASGQVDDLVATAEGVLDTDIGRVFPPRAPRVGAVVPTVVAALKLLENFGAAVASGPTEVAPRVEGPSVAREARHGNAGRQGGCRGGPPTQALASTTTPILRDVTDLSVLAKVVASSDEGLRLEPQRSRPHVWPASRGQGSTPQTRPTSRGHTCSRSRSPFAGRSRADRLDPAPAA